MLAAMGSKGDPMAADVEKILGSVGVEVEANKVKTVVSELQGKILELIKGTKKLASLPSGAAVVAAAAGAAPHLLKKQNAGMSSRETSKTRVCEEKRKALVHIAVSSL